MPITKQMQMGIIETGTDEMAMKINRFIIDFIFSDREKSSIFYSKTVGKCFLPRMIDSILSQRRKRCMKKCMKALSFQYNKRNKGDIS